MNGIEAMKALLEGKTVKVVKSDWFTLGRIVKINTDGDGLTELRDADTGVTIGWSVNEVLASEFEEMPEYRLTFFEAMRALQQGRTVANEYLFSTYRMKDDTLVNQYDEEESFSKREISAKWRIVK